MEKAEIRAINDLRCAARKLCTLFREHKLYGSSDDLKEAVRKAAATFDGIRADEEDGDDTRAQDTVV